MSKNIQQLPRETSKSPLLSAPYGMNNIELKRITLTPDEFTTENDGAEPLHGSVVVTYSTHTIDSVRAHMNAIGGAVHSTAISCGAMFDERDDEMICAELIIQNGSDQITFQCCHEGIDVTYSAHFTEGDAETV